MKESCWPSKGRARNLLITSWTRIQLSHQGRQLIWCVCVCVCVCACVCLYVCVCVVFLGVCKYRPIITASHGELVWEPCISRQRSCTGRHVVRMSCTNRSRLNKRIALWASANASPRCRSWFFVFTKRCKELNSNFDVNISRPISKILVNSLHNVIVNWFNSSYNMKVVTKEWSIAEKISHLSWDSNPVCPGALTHWAKESTPWRSCQRVNYIPSSYAKSAKADDGR